MIYTFELNNGRFLISPSREFPERYNLLWEGPERVETVKREVEGIVAFQAVITQSTGIEAWDSQPVENIPGEIYDFSLWTGHRSFAETTGALLQAS